ncbi:MurR/RpiR family transcriptional regulator [Sutcliffiella horikoshii]|uniref:MurR/RpiR family transcriptional regulator n=1 Tax=Sutcliffiella horikoshii TaxID=79883 RepID=A0A5D4SW64_9BACI|nr:MurR/RpiR family transcriptional regulator [Sutcliffiella horikoshii]TYS67535.1 MurR/RpiR family transcriptional regulator [Sutcliffiella horikoshii]
MNGGLLRLREALSTINPAERNAATFILEHPEEVCTLSVKELADKSNSSQAAIIRLCKKIGLEGYKELKLRIAGDVTSISSNNLEAYHEFKYNADIPTFMKTITENNIKSLRDTLELLDKEEVTKAVQMLHTAHRIDFYGVAASQLIAQDAQQKFMRINKLCTAYSDSHLQLTSATTMTKGDVAVGISYSGETTQTIEAIREAKKAGALTIAITKYGMNSLKELSDISLSISSMESSIRSAATSSRISQLNVIDILFTAVAAIDFEQSVEYLKKSRETIKNTYR